MQIRKSNTIINNECNGLISTHKVVLHTAILFMENKRAAVNDNIEMTVQTM